jgi:hypothetical protein
MSPYAVFLLYLLAILGFAGFTLLLNRLLGPRPAPTDVKLEPFECGATVIDPANVKAVPIKYYAVAIVFDRAQPALAQLARETSIAHGVLVLAREPASLLPLVQRLKDEFSFDLLLDVTAVDRPGESPRFEVVWHFYSTQHKLRVRVKTRVAEADPTVDSLVALYGAARLRVFRRCPASSRSS